MTFIICKTIFIPNTSFFKVNINSVIDMANYISKYKLNCIVLICGYIDKNLITDKNNILMPLTQHNITYIEDVNTINYGKTYYLQKLHNFTNFDFVVYFDHDIFIDKHTDPLLFTNNILIDMSFGIIAFNQIGDVRHNYIDLKNQKYNDIDIFVSQHEYAIASGAFILGRHNIGKLIDLNVNFVYGYDERNLYNLFKDKYNIILQQFCVYHPFDNNFEYRDLKKSLIINSLQKQINYLENMDEIDNFFNSSRSK